MKKNLMLGMVLCITFVLASNVSYAGPKFGVDGISSNIRGSYNEQANQGEPKASQKDDQNYNRNGDVVGRNDGLGEDVVQEVDVSDKYKGGGQNNNQNGDDMGQNDGQGGDVIHQVADPDGEDRRQRARQRAYSAIWFDR